MTEVESTDTRPDYLLPKFKTVEDQARAYVEAQKLLGQRAAPEAPKIAPLGGEPETFNADASTAFARQMAKFNTSLAKYVAGNPEGANELIAMGVDPRAARMGLGVAQDTQRQYDAMVQAPAGGREAFDGLNEWMQSSPEVHDFERESYRQALASGDINRATQAVTHMTNKHRESTGYTPQQLTHVVPGGGQKRVSGYSDIYEVGQAYEAAGKDPVKLAEFDARCSVSECLQNGFVPGYQNHSSSERLPAR
jgi:hypothetical protein